MFNVRKALEDFLNVSANREMGSPEDIQFHVARRLMKKVQPMVDMGEYDAIVRYLTDEFDYYADRAKYDEADVALAALTAVRHHLNYV